MNHIFRLIWNHQTAAFVVVSEHAKSCGGKTSSGFSAGNAQAGETFFTVRKLAVSMMLAFTSNAYALPSGMVVASGAASVVGGAGNLTVNQNSQNVALNWQNFNINAGESVKFVQPNSSAVALNRVMGADPTTILGSLSANGKIFLVNPNGILFGKGAQVNVGALAASSLNISDSDFMAGHYQFANGGGTILNQGSITAADGGYIALLGGKVSNEGVLSARLGTVALAAGNAITIDLAGDGLLNVTIQQGVLKALAQNGGLIQADGGAVVLTTQAAGDLLRGVVNNTGMIEARTLTSHNGRISLLGDMQSGTVNAGGTLDASAPHGGNGGFIETSAAHVVQASDLHVTTLAPQGTTGTWLIDPNDYTVAASGGDTTGTDLSRSLASSNIELKSNMGPTAGAGNVNINDAVTWSANTRLTLTASNNVNVNANIVASGNNAALVLNPNTANTAGGTPEAASGSGVFNLGTGSTITLSGSAPTLSIGGASYSVINNAASLQAMSSNLASNYALGGSIDASSITNFSPVGATGGAFTGAFNGLGHAISNLSIDGGTNSYVGLFGAAGSMPRPTTLSNVNLVNATIRGASYVGALAGWLSGSISNSSVTGTVSAPGSYVGGLAGWITGNLSNSSGSATVAANGSYIGGLTGWITGNISNAQNSGAVTAVGNSNGSMVGNGTYIGGLAGWVTGAVSASSATGNVSGTGGYVGGLLGWITGNTSDSYASGNVAAAGAAASYNGGLVGWSTGNITGSDATGNVTANAPAAVYTGGLAGWNTGNISTSFASGNVIGSGGYTGGLAGQMTGTVRQSYASGSVTSTDAAGAYVGGLVGNLSNGGIENSYAWGSVNTSSATADYVGGLVGDSTHSNILNSYSVGKINAPTATPHIGGLIGNQDSTGSVVNSYWDYVTSGMQTSNGGLPMNTPDMKLYVDFTSKTTANTPSGGGSNATIPTWDFINIWDIINTVTYPSLRGKIGTLIPLTVTANNVSQAYNASGFVLSDIAYSTAPNLTWLGLLSNTGTSTSALNVGSYSIVPSYSPQSHYRITYVGGTLTITPKILSAPNLTASAKTYDGLDTAVINGSLGGVLNGDPVGLGGTFANKNAGSAIAVTVSLTGAGISNYALPGTTPLLHADITPQALTAVVSDVNQTYNGTVAATPILTLMHLVAGENLNVSSTGNLSSKSVGSGNKVIAATAVLADGVGGKATNYTLSYSDITQGNATITPRSITVSNAQASNKPYDGLLNDTVTGNLNGVLSGDVVTLSGAFANKNVGKGMAVAISLADTDGGNYILATPPSLSADITARVLTATTNALTQTYNGSPNVTPTLTLFNVVPGENLNATTTATLSSKSAGSNKVTVTNAILTDGVGGMASNYTLSYVNVAPGSATINPLGLTVSNAQASSKIYDGLLSDSVTGLLNGVLGSDAVTLSGTFANKNVGTGIAVATSLTGADSGNYILAAQPTLNANINARVLSATANAITQTYNGTTAATPTLTLGNLVPGENLNVSTTATLNSKSAGNNQVTFTNATLANGTGGLASNYTLDYTKIVLGSVIINPLGVTVNNAQASNKPYDGLYSDNVIGDLKGILGSDVVKLSGTFAGKNVGTGIAVATSLAGADAGNYTLSTPPLLSANINARALTATANAVTQTYNGTTAVTPTLILGNVVPGESLNVSSTGNLSSKNVSNGNQVLVTKATLADGVGGMASNYSLDYNAIIPGNATINPLGVTVSGAQASSKIYDGMLGGTVSGTLSGVLSGDVVTLSGTFANKNVGKGVAVAASLAGTDGGNYVLATQPNLSADITARALSATASAVTQNYNGTTAAAPTLTLGNLVPGESLNVTSVATLSNKNVGSSNNQVNVTKATLTDGVGGLASNYTLDYTSIAPTSATINPVTVTVNNVQASNKPYDGLLGDTVSGTLNGVLGKDVVTLSGAFANKNTGKGISVAASLGGADGGNYVLAPLLGLSADITPRVLSATANAVTQIYNGATAATPTLTLANLVPGENLNVATAGTLRNKDVGSSGNQVTVTSATLADGAGGLASNYALDYKSIAPASATITPLSVTLSGAQTSNKTYDGTLLASVNGTLNGVLASDNVTLSGQFASKDVKAGIVVTPVLAGSLSADYQLTPLSTTLTAEIIAKALSAVASASNQVYNGSAVTTPTLVLSGLVPGETVTATAAGSFTTQNVINNNQVTVTSSRLVDGAGTGGGLASNYSLDYRSIAPVNANITPKPVNVTPSMTPQASDKAYDGTLLAKVSGTLDGVLAGDNVTLGGQFASKDVKAGIAVTANLQGLLASNYQLTPLATPLTAAILTKALNATASVSDQIYNGKSATITAPLITLSGFAPGETVSAVASASFTSSNVIANNQATVTSAKLVDGSGGGLASNYSLDYTTIAAVNAKILPKTVTETGAIAASKIYDGGTTATLNNGQLSGLISTDSNAVMLSGNFASKDVGSAIAVTASLTGVASGNYTLIQPATALAADITAKALTLSSISADPKTYDGNTRAQLQGMLVGVIPADINNVILNGTFADKNVNPAIVVTASLSGTASTNYSLTPTGATLTAAITPKPVTVADLTVATMVNNGVASAVVTSGKINGLVAGDSNAVGLSGTVDGATKVSVTLNGRGASNYALAAQQAALNLNGATATMTMLPILTSFRGNEVNASLPVRGLNEPFVSGDTAPAADNIVDNLASTTDALGGMNLTVLNLGIRLPLDNQKIDRNNLIEVSADVVE